MTLQFLDLLTMLKGLCLHLGIALSRFRNLLLQICIFLSHKLNFGLQILLAGLDILKLLL